MFSCSPRMSHRMSILVRSSVEQFPSRMDGVVTVAQPMMLLIKRNINRQLFSPPVCARVPWQFPIMK